MAIEIVDFPIENGGSFHSKLLVYQRVLDVVQNQKNHPFSNFDVFSSNAISKSQVQLVQLPEAT